MVAQEIECERCGFVTDLSSRKTARCSGCGGDEAAGVHWSGCSAVIARIDAEKGVSVNGVSPLCSGCRSGGPHIIGCPGGREKAEKTVSQLGTCSHCGFYSDPVGAVQQHAVNCPVLSSNVSVGDPINRPSHYTAHPSGVECIQVTEHMNFNLGNAVKYLWRAGLKGVDPLEDLKKAAWYVAREIGRLEKGK